LKAYDYVKKAGRADYPESLQRLAVGYSWEDVLKYIENPSEAVQLLAVKKDREAIRFIKKPAASVLKWLSDNPDPAQK
jgi:hypothetical protein